jgi:flavodoxin
MRKILVLIMAMMLVLGLAACSGNSSETAPNDAGSSEEASESQTEESTQNGADTLVVYFSMTGTTKGVAEKIADIECADLYEIKAAQDYTDDDLDWNNDDSRTTHEQNDPSARPEIGSNPVSLEGYSTVYIGYPIWWGQEPRIMDTFVESYSFDGKTVIPFCTSGSSGIGDSGRNLAENAGSGNWLDGNRFDGSVSEDELRTWIDEMK